MRRQEKVFLLIVTLWAVIFCSGKDVYSNYAIQTNGAELTTGAKSDGNNAMSDVYFFDDEQFNLLSEFITAVDLEHQIPYSQNCTLILRCPAPVWQPPKNQ